MISIKILKPEDTYPIRLEVLRKNIPKPFKFDGDFEKDTIHLGAFKNDTLIAVSSYMKVSNPNFKGSQFQLRGMATLEKFQGIGAGKVMMNEAFTLLKNKNIDCVWCNAREIAVPFYKKLGFEIFGNKFDIEYIGAHYVMYKYL